MQENDTEEFIAEKEVEKNSNDKPEIGEESAWSKDQQERNYYYDDAFGYEKFSDEEE